MFRQLIIAGGLLLPLIAWSKDIPFQISVDLQAEACLINEGMTQVIDFGQIGGSKTETVKVIKAMPFRLNCGVNASGMVDVYLESMGDYPGAGSIKPEIGDSRLGFEFELVGYRKLYNGLGHYKPVPVSQLENTILNVTATIPAGVSGDFFGSVLLVIQYS